MQAARGYSAEARSICIQDDAFMCVACVPQGGRFDDTHKNMTRSCVRHGGTHDVMSQV